MNTLASVLADAQTYHKSGGTGMGLLVAAAVLWLMFGGKKK